MPPSAQRKEFTEPDFLPRLKVKDQKLLHEIIQRYSKEIYRASRGLGFNETQAEDLVQEVFCAFLQSLDRFEGRSHIRTWIFGILFRKSMEAKRKIGKEKKEDDIDKMVDEKFDSVGHWNNPPENPETIENRAQVAQFIQECMEKLPAKQAQAFVLKEVNGFSTSEICKIMDVSATNLGVLIHRARNQLRLCIERKVGST